MTSLFQRASKFVISRGYECLWEIYEQNKNLVDMPTLEKVLCRLDGV
jgi:hypothetical protein